MKTQATWQERAGSGRVPRALIADDQRAVAEVVARSCADIAAFDLVPSGRDAIDHLRGNASYRAILCDVHMPGGGGRQVVEYLQASAPQLLPRVVLMSGAPLHEAWARGIACVQKPFEFDELRSILSGLLSTGLEGSGTFQAG